ncbi:MAG: aminotransferase class V-fold PLP-dependent enzyme [Thermoplasmata archaeon]
MNVENVRKDFPILRKRFNGKPIIYLDSACQSLRPRQVIKEMTRYYEEFPACAGRSIHKLATYVSIEMDEAREKLSRYVNASKPEEICFLRNCTEALNTVIFGMNLRRGDTVLTTDREHNSIHIPLLKLRETTGIRYEWVPSRSDETFDIEMYSEIVSKIKPKLIAMCHTSNVNGVTIPAREVCEIAHDRGASVLLDGAQFAPYGPFDIRKIDADFYAFSSHKMCGPSGVGILTGKYEKLAALEPRTYGGHGVTMATRKKAEILPPPERFEAGLQNYSGIMGAMAAAEYLSKIGRRQIEAHVRTLNVETTRRISDNASLRMIPPTEADLRGGILSFNIIGRSPHDVAIILDDAENIMIRSGMHCNHSWFKERGIEGSARASFYIYNTKEEARKLADAIDAISR